MKCFTCTDRIGNYESDKEICARCREVFKVDLVNMILGLDPVYLSESNRNKKGRKPKLTATQMNDIRWAYSNPKEGTRLSMRDLAKQHDVTVGTISNIIHSHY